MGKLLGVVYLVLVMVTNVQAEHHSFAYDVAARCKGEADFAIPECACTVYNRLQAGWSEALVLSAYYAPDKAPSRLEVWVVEGVLEQGCNQPLYFMFGRGDLWVVGDTQPYCYVETKWEGVYFYELDYKDRASPVAGGVCSITGQE
jgi:hypothetical protein